MDGNTLEIDPDFDSVSIIHNLTGLSDKLIRNACRNNSKKHDELIMF